MATTRYVSTTGNDANDGSAADNAHAWLTLDHALTTINIAGDYVIRMLAGSYAENSSSSGSLQFGRLYSALVSVVTDSGLQDVTITNATTANTYVMQNTASLSNLNFTNLTFSAIAGTTYTWNYNCQTNSTALSFTNCVFNSPPGSGAGMYGIYGVGTPATFTSDITFTGCTFNHATGSSGAAVYILTAASGSQVIAVNMINCTCNSNQTGVQLDGVSMTANIQGGHFSGTSFIALILGNDTPTSGRGVTGTVKGATCTSTSSHAFEVGDIATGVVVTGCTFNGGDYAGVWKNCGTGNVCENNVFVGGSLACLIVKSCANAVTFAGNTFRATGAYAIINTDASATAGANNIIRGNRIIANGSANVYNWAQAKDSGGTVIDYNVYDIRGSGNFGTIYATSGVTTLSGLKAAWSAYGAGTNESHSQLASTEYLLQTKYTATGSWLYMQIENQQGKLWNKTAFETITTANYPFYCLPLAEDPASGYYYSQPFQLQVPLGEYKVTYYVRGGLIDAPSDAQVGVPVDVLWNGTARVNPFDETLRVQILS